MIILTGAHGTGKTTTFNRLRERLGKFRWQFEESQTRSILAENPKATQKDITDKLIPLYEQKIGENRVVFDRFYFDILGYCKSGSKEARLVQSKLAVFDFKAGDKIFYFPIELDYIHADGVRPTDKKEQKLVDERIRKSLLLVRGKAPIYYCCGDIETKVEIILRSLKWWEKIL